VRLKVSLRLCWGNVVPKPGMDYQHLVAVIEATFDPGALVTEGEWIEGPDGRRECDVSVRGTRQGQPYFAFIECKDWRGRTVCVPVIDALDSKRRDIGADLTAVYSNSGFSLQARQKARRVGINTFIAVATGDLRSRARGGKLIYGRVLNIVGLTKGIIEPPGHDFPLPIPLGQEELRFEGEPVHNWAVEEVQSIMTQYGRQLERPSRVIADYRFDDSVSFSIREKSFPVAGMQLDIQVAIEWRAKILDVEIERGRFDAQTGLLWTPPDVPVTFLGIDDTGWEERVEQPAPEEEASTDTGSIFLRAHILTGVAKVAGGTPDLTAHFTGTPRLILPE
jgi:hypothetical protein